MLTHYIEGNCGVEGLGGGGQRGEGGGGRGEGRGEGVCVPPVAYQDIHEAAHEDSCKDGTHDRKRA